MANGFKEKSLWHMAYSLWSETTESIFLSRYML